MILRPFLVLGAMPVGYATSALLNLAAAAGRALRKRPDEPAGQPPDVSVVGVAAHDPGAPSLTAAAVERDAT